MVFIIIGNFIICNKIMMLWYEILMLCIEILLICYDMVCVLNYMIDVIVYKILLFECVLIFKNIKKILLKLEKYFVFE